MTRCLSTVLILLVLVPAAGLGAAPAPRLMSPERSIRGIVFDPADYYATGMGPAELAATLVARWSQAGANVVYMNAYNVIYGAHYRTVYPLTHMDDFGRADLLGIMIREAHARGMLVFAAFYSQTHRGAWLANPEWRAKRADGRDYSPRGVDVQYFLSIWHPDVLRWWDGLIADVLTSYPDLDGIELREPVINWWGHEADYNPRAVAAFRRAHPGRPLGGTHWRRWRAAGLTRFVGRTVHLVRGQGRRTHLTTVVSAWADGRLLTAREQADQTGFDLDGVLSASHVPDAVKAEVIWQQWGNVYDYATFSPEWTGRAAASVLEMVAGRARTIVHVELTDFGRRAVPPEDTYLAIRAARRAGVHDFDVYGAGLADEKEAWPWMRRAFTEDHAPPTGRGQDLPVRRLVLFEDLDRERSGIPRLATTLLLNLLGHFDVAVEVRPTDGYRRGTIDDFDAVIYQGTAWGAALPATLIDDLTRYRGPILWIGANLWQLTRGQPVTRFGVLQRPPIPQEAVDAVRYGRTFLRGYGLTILGLERDPSAEVRATASAGARTLPVAVRSGRFWYIAGHLFPDAGRNPLQWIAAELLHEVLQIPHEEDRSALLMVTGITPLTDPAQLAALQRAAGGEGGAILLGVTPVFVDPVRQVRVVLAERPALRDELQALVRTGASIVLTGYTHQYHGRTGQDLEFWDRQAGTGVAEDSPEFVQARAAAGIRELLAAGLVPVAWSTPGGLASPFDYTVLGGLFGAAIEQRVYGFSGGHPVQQRFPYAVHRDVHGHTVFSPNLGVDPPTTPEGIEEAARELRTVRDALAVTVLPITTPAAEMRRVMRVLLQQGFRPVDLRDRLVVEIRTDEHAIASRGGTIHLQAGAWAVVHEYDVDRSGRRRGAGAAWISEPKRIEFAPDLPPGWLRVAEVRTLAPWSAQGILLRVRMAAGPSLRSVPPLELGSVARLTVVGVSVLSALIVVVLAVAHALAGPGRSP